MTAAILLKWCSPILYLVIIELYHCGLFTEIKIPTFILVYNIHGSVTEEVSVDTQPVLSPAAKLLLRREIKLSQTYIITHTHASYVIMYRVQ